MTFPHPATPEQIEQIRLYFWLIDNSVEAQMPIFYVTLLLAGFGLFLRAALHRAFGRQYLVDRIAEGVKL